MNNMPYGTLRDIASELKMIRKVLERMAQAPMFEKRYDLYFSLTDDAHNEDDEMQ